MSKIFSEALEGLTILSPEERQQVVSQVLSLLDEQHIRDEDKGRLLQNIIDDRKDALLKEHIRRLVIEFLLQRNQISIDKTIINRILNEAIREQKKRP